MTTIVRGRLSLRAGDLSNPVRITVRYFPSGAPFDFTGWTLPKFSLSRETADGLEVVLQDVDAIWEDQPGGTLRYDWQAGDTDLPGSYRGVFTVLDPLSDPRSFPDQDFVRISIEEAL